MRCFIRRSIAATATTCSRRASRRRPARRSARSCSPRADAVSAAAAGKDVILVRPFTEADDVAGFHAAKGILTSEGGKASHAALVARGMGVPAVTGARDRGRPRRRRADDRRPGVQGRRQDRDRRLARATVVEAGAKLIQPEIDERFDTVLEWADELRRLGVRVNADTPTRRRAGARARRRGHRAVPDRAHVHGRGSPAQDAGDDHGRRPRRPASGARASCCRSSEEDFVGLFEAMRGLPVTIRLLDPPLHEFLPEPARAARAGGARPDRGDRRPRRAREAARAGRGDPRGQPDARHPRRPARDPLPGDLRDAGARDHAGRARRSTSRPIPRS